MTCRTARRALVLTAGGLLALARLALGLRRAEPPVAPPDPPPEAYEAEAQRHAELLARLEFDRR